MSSERVGSIRSQNNTFLVMQNISRWIIILITTCHGVSAFFSFGDNGSRFPKLYEGWFDGQVAKQVQSAVAKASSAGIVSASILNFKLYK